LNIRVLHEIIVRFLEVDFWLDAGKIGESSSAPMDGIRR
jgi:hypothetical protein